MRLIDADALDAEMYHKSFEIDDGRNVWNSGLWIRYKIFEEAIRDAPTIDAVPVIRCKDCKYWLPHSQFGFDEDNEEYYDYCELLVPDDDYYAITRQAEDFCSKAERKEE